MNCFLEGLISFRFGSSDEFDCEFASFLVMLFLDEFVGSWVSVDSLDNLTLMSYFGQMTTAIAIEDVRREVKILRALTGHSNLVQFHAAFEDQENVYIVME